MNTKISSGLKTLFLVHFIMGVIFGLINLLIAAEWYNLFGLKISDAAPYCLVGAAILGFAAGSWFGFRAVNWEQVRIIVLTELVWPPLAALVSLFFALQPNQTAALVWWVNFVIMAGFAIAFYIYFNKQEAAVKAPAPKAVAAKPVAKKAVRRRSARAYR